MVWGLDLHQSEMVPPSELSRLATALGGVPITGCLRNSPADRAGIRYGDIMLSINGEPTASWTDFFQARKRAKGRMTVRVFRQGREFDVALDMPSQPLCPRAVLEELSQRDLLPRAVAPVREVFED